MKIRHDNRIETGKFEDGSGVFIGIYFAAERRWLFVEMPYWQARTIAKQLERLTHPNIPPGVSEWREHGKKYGYDKYYGIKWSKE